MSFIQHGGIIAALISRENILRRKKIYFSTLVIAVLIVAFCYSFFARQKAEAQAPVNKKNHPSVLVAVAPVVQKNLNKTYKTVGTLESVQEVNVSPEIAGQVKAILFEQGKFVKAGTVLVQLDSSTYQAKLLAAKAALESSRIDYLRTQQLIQKNVFAKSALDTTQLTYQQKEADLQSAQSDLDKTTIRAPFDGVLGARKINLGEYVTAGQALVSLTDIANLKAVYQLPEDYLGQVKTGQKVQITTKTSGSKSYEGRVNFVAPTINLNTRSFEVQAAVPNPNAELAPGQFINITQFLTEDRSALLVPRRAVVATVSGPIVYRVVNGKAVATPVKTGQETKNNIQILSGLNVGDKVVTDGTQDLSDGMSVKVSNVVTTK